MFDVSSEAGQFRLLRMYPLLYLQRDMHFTQPAKIDEEDSGGFQAQGRQDRTSWPIPWIITCQDEVR